MGVDTNDTLNKMGGGGYFLPSAEHDCANGSYGVIFVVLFFQFINWIVKSVGPPKSLRDDEWKWRNLTISYLHAFICVVGVITSFATQPELLTDLKHYRSDTVLYLVILSTGYFLYDFLDLALNGKMIAMWEVQLHHVAVAMMFYYNVAGCIWLPFNIIALLVEVNSFFLHQRKLLQMLGVSFNSKLYRVTVFLNLFTFVIFRTFPMIAILWGMVALFHQVERMYFICLVFSMFFLVGMNPILFMRLLHSDYLRDSSSKYKAAHEAKGKRNGNSNLLQNHNHVKSS